MGSIGFRGDGADYDPTGSPGVHSNACHSSSAANQEASLAACDRVAASSDPSEAADASNYALPSFTLPSTDTLVAHVPEEADSRDDSEQEHETDDETDQRERTGHVEQEARAIP